MSKYSTAVIGGAGRIGLPFSIVNALAERKTIVFDTNKELVSLIKQGKLPYKENGLEEALKKALVSKHLIFADDPIKMQFSDVVVVTIGTPVDPYLKPDCNSMIEALRPYFPYLNNKHLIIRSTVYPGGIKDIKANLKKNGVEVFISYAPERAVQGDTLNEMKRTPQLVSGEDEQCLKYCSDFFAEISPSIVELQPEEAELVKLFTNAYRYTHFAIANQFLQIATDLKCDYKRIESAMRVGYPRLEDMPTSGFTAGPCLEGSSKVLQPFKVTEIREIKLGDQVFDGQQFTLVKDIASRFVNTYRLINSRGIELKGSLDHIHMVVDPITETLTEKNFADITERDWLYVPKPDLNFQYKYNVSLGERPLGVKWWPSIVELTPRLARIIGLFLAEGHHDGFYGTKRKTWTAAWSFGYDEESLADEVIETLKEIGLNAKKQYQISKGTFGLSKIWRVRVRSRGFNLFLDKLNIGHLASGKKTPIFKGELAKALIGGWLDGDGCRQKGLITGFSRSKNLIFNMQLMLLDLGICPSIHNNGQEISISTRDEVKEVSSWTKTFKFDESYYVRDFSYESPNMRKLNEGWAIKVGKAETVKEVLEVFSIETESKRYTANSILTHNCLRKDTLLLASVYPEFTLGKSAFWINENLPSYIVSKLDAKYGLQYKKVGILGLAFKAENDDTRDSLAMRLRKLLKVKAKKVLCHDPYVQNEDTVGLQEILEEADIIILATPHDCYRSLSKVAGPVVIDIWNYLDRRVGLN